MCGGRIINKRHRPAIKKKKYRRKGCGGGWRASPHRGGHGSSRRPRTGCPHRWKRTGTPSHSCPHPPLPSTPGDAQLPLRPHPQPQHPPRELLRANPPLLTPRLPCAPRLLGHPQEAVPTGWASSDTRLMLAGHRQAAGSSRWLRWWQSSCRARQGPPRPPTPASPGVPSPQPPLRGQQGCRQGPSLPEGQSGAFMGPPGRSRRWGRARAHPAGLLLMGAGEAGGPAAPCSQEAARCRMGQSHPLHGHPQGARGSSTGTRHPPQPKHPPHAAPSVPAPSNTGSHCEAPGTPRNPRGPVRPQTPPTATPAAPNLPAATRTLE